MGTHPTSLHEICHLGHCHPLALTDGARHEATRDVTLATSALFISYLPRRTPMWSTIQSFGERRWVVDSDREAAALRQVEA